MMMVKSNKDARDYFWLAYVMEEFSDFLSKKGERLTKVPSPGAIVQDERGKMFVYRQHGNEELLDTMGNNGLQPLCGGWHNYDIVQDSPDPETDLGKQALEWMEKEDRGEG
jgi:hypothetical protein